VVKPPGEKAFTLTEALVALVVIVALGAVLIGSGTITVCLTSEIHKGQMLQMQSNMKQLHLATLSMVLDGTTTGDVPLQWPGNRGGSFSNWAQSIVPSYLSTNDFCKLLSGPGRTVSPSNLPTANTNAVLVYAVQEASASNTVFLTSANFTNTETGGRPPSEESKPFSTKGFLVFRKDGTGSILKISAVGKTNKIGAFAPLCH
jgi:hypothetical protein